MGSRYLSIVSLGEVTTPLLRYISHYGSHQEEDAGNEGGEGQCL